MRSRLASVALALAVAGPAAAEEGKDTPVLDWDTGEGKSYVVPALEIPAFIIGLNVFNRAFIDSKTYGTDGHSIGKNLRTAPDFDTDPFGVNQLGHPYQGSIYYGAARSAGLSYWESLGASVFGSVLWETAGFGAAGTVGDRGERDYRYGVIPEPLLGLRLIVGELAMLEAQGRQYWVVGLGAGASPNADRSGHETIHRGNVGLTVRVFGPHALSLGYVGTRRDARVAEVGDRHQSVHTLTLSYNFLGHTKFGAVEWRPAELR